MFLMRKLNRRNLCCVNNLFVCRFLASMNLPAAIEDSGGRQIPPSLVEKANEIKRQGGITTLEKMVNELPTSLNRNKEILDEVCLTFVDIFIFFSFD
jgi:hypothetical protein